MSPSPSLKPPIALLLHWSHGDASKVLNRINVPVEASLVNLPSPDLATFVSSLNEDSKLADELSPEKFAVAVVGGEPSEGDARGVMMCVRALYAESPTGVLSDFQQETITLSLMRAKYCSRVRADLVETIKSRRVD